MEDPVALASLWYAKWTFWVTLVAVALSVIAIRAAFVAIWRADLNSSAATLMALHDGFRGSWPKFLAAQRDKNESEMNYQFGELMNLIEINCGLHHAKSLKGVSEELSAEYLISILNIFKDNTDLVRMMRALKDERNTFKYTQKFCCDRGLQEVFSPTLATP